jgi:hypothetical protein
MEENKPKPAAKHRRPYLKPEMQSFELFERRSLTCGTVPNGPRTASCGVHQSVA